MLAACNLQTHSKLYLPRISLRTLAILLPCYTQAHPTVSHPPSSVNLPGHIDPVTVDVGSSSGRVGSFHLLRVGIGTEIQGVLQRRQLHLGRDVVRVTVQHAFVACHCHAFVVAERRRETAVGDTVIRTGACVPGGENEVRPLWGKRMSRGGGLYTCLLYTSPSPRDA